MTLADGGGVISFDICSESVLSLKDKPFTGKISRVRPIGKEEGIWKWITLLRLKIEIEMFASCILFYENKVLQKQNLLLIGLVVNN